MDPCVHIVVKTPPPIPFNLAAKGANSAKFQTTSTGNLSQLWHQSGQCPEGTVAIRRTMVKDVLRVGTLSEYKRKRNGLSAVPNPQPSRTQSMSDSGHEVSDTQSPHQYCIIVIVIYNIIQPHTNR